MKSSSILSLLQLIVIAVLVIKIIGLDKQLQLLNSTNQENLSTAQGLEKLGGLDNHTNEYICPPVTSVCNINSSTIKQIVSLIDEKFANMYLSMPIDQRSIEPEDHLLDDPQQTDQAVQLERVNQELDHFLDLGVIPEQKMEELLTEIAQLNDHERQQALRRLVKAMNSGDLDAHF
ncbi:MAG: hypothetical protein IMF09_05150 [Proteobacteria bacterium]|nr:hypothetical protein [Pseudomonadota bacterium]